MPPSPSRSRRRDRILQKMKEPNFFEDLNKRFEETKAFVEAKHNTQEILIKRLNLREVPLCATTGQTCETCLYWISTKFMVCPEHEGHFCLPERIIIDYGDDTAAVMDKNQLKSMWTGNFTGVAAPK